MISLNSHKIICPITGSSEYRQICTQNGYQWVQFLDSEFVRLAKIPEEVESLAIQDATVTAGYIDSYRKKISSKFRRSFQRAKYLRKHLRSGQSVLDIGSNIGFFVESCRLLNMIPHGLDINEGLVDEAKRIFPHCDFTATALEDFKPGKTYDGIYCSEVIEHVIDPVDFVSKILMLLKDHGVLYLTTPSADEYLSGYEVKRDMGAPDHKLYFNQRNIIIFLREVGFSKIKHKFSLGGGIQIIAWK